MSGLLPPSMRCSAFWYAQARGLPADIDSLLGLGLVAARIARWEGLEAWQVAEGPYWVHMWPEHVWDEASRGGMPAVTRPANPPSGPVARFWDQPDPWEPSVWSYPPPPEDTQAYADWMAMTDEDMTCRRDPDYGYGDYS